MIYIVAGSDTYAKSSYIKKIAKTEIIRLPLGVANRALLFEYASQDNLFGEATIVCIDGFLKEGNESLLAKDLEILKESPTIFIFNEDKLLSAEQKRYAKYATVEILDSKKEKVAPKINVFAIADAYARKDKVQTWILYREAIDHGVEPESICGMLFWKIKTIILASSRTFDQQNLKRLSGELVSLYHESHNGTRDFTVGLEQFILSSLS